MTAPPHRPGPAFWPAVAAGSALVIVGLRSLWQEQRENLRSIGTWFVGGALALDLLLVPLAAGVGLGLRRVVPAWAWPAARSALLATAALAGFGYPLVTDRGGQPGNPTLRPRDYDRGLLVAVAAVWLTAAVVAAAARAARVRSDRDARPADTRFDRDVSAAESAQILRQGPGATSADEGGRAQR